MPPPTLVSVLIPNYNGEPFIARCIESVVSQTGPFEVELIVHDDASTDRSLEVIRSIDVQLTVIPSRTNVGFCRANNRMAQFASGSVLVLLNNDATLREGALAAMVQLLNDPSVGIASVPQYAHGQLLDRGCQLDPFLSPVPVKGGAVAMVMGACLAIRRTDWLAIGGFPWWFESIAEDVFLCLAITGMNMRIQVASSSGFDHEVGASFGGGKADSSGKLVTTTVRRKLSERNRFHCSMLFHKPAIRWVYAAGFFASWLAEALVLSISHLSTRVAVAVYLAAFREQRHARHHRLKTRQQLLRAGVALRWRLASTHLPSKLRMLVHHGWPRL